MVFLYNLCLPDAQENLQSVKFAPEVVKDLADLKQTVEAVKTMVDTLSSLAATPTAEQPKAKYSNVDGNYDLELRFSGLLELKSSKLNLSKQVNVKPDRKKNF